VLDFLDLFVVLNAFTSITQPVPQVQKCVPQHVPSSTSLFQHALPNIVLLKPICQVNKCDLLVSMFVLSNFICRSLQVS
jgi:hypothetical protein